MKKMFLVLMVLFVVTCARAQPEKPYIEVNGLVAYEAAVQQYEAIIVLSPAMDYNYPAASPFTEIRKCFFEAIRQHGFKEDAFKEDKLAFVTGDYQGEGTVYKFQTTSAETFIKLKELEKVRGARIQYKKMHYKMAGDTREWMKKALEDARRKAADIATTLNRKLGAPIALSDLNTGVTESYNYLGESKNYYQIVVRFAIE